MFLIFGLRTKATRLGPVLAACPVCRQSGNLLLDRENTKFSLFFIPLIPIRTKHLLQCLNPVCGARVKVDNAEARRLLAQGSGCPN